MARKVSILLPALNEERSIGAVIDDLPIEAFVKRGYETEVVVVDGHSIDRTMEIAAEKGARLIMQKGRGKGDALRTAFKQIDSDYTFMLDADCTYPSSYLLIMLNRLEKGKHDVIMGSRFDGYIEPGAMSMTNRFGNKFLSTTANMLFPNGHKVTDVCTGMWGFTKDALKNLRITADGFEVEAEMYAKSIKMGFRVGEIPISYRRTESQSKLSSIKDGARICWKLIKERTNGA